MIFPHAERFSPGESWVKEVADKINMDIASLSTVNLPRHPSQLYEAFAEGILLWALLWFVLRGRKRFEGAVTGWYLIGYGAFRFIIEYFREPDAGLDFPILLGKPSPNYVLASLFNFTAGQIFCFLMITSGIILLFLFRLLDGRRKSTGLLS